MWQRLSSYAARSGFQVPAAKSPTREGEASKRAPASGLLIAVLLGVGLAGVGGVLNGVVLMASGGMGVVGGLLVVAGGVLLGGLGVVLGSFGVVLGGLLVVVCGFGRHGWE